MKKRIKMCVLSVLSFVSIGLCGGLKNQVNVDAGEVTPWEVRYDFENATGISGGMESFMWDNATEWMGNSYVTAREDFVINGNYSYHVWLNSPGAWKMAAGVKIPSNGTYTVKFRYKMINLASYGTVKFGSDSWANSSNRGIGFGYEGINAEHNIATDYAISNCIDEVNGIHELTTVVTTGDLDQYMFFSSMDNGAEYVIDDLVVKQGDHRDDITLNAMVGSNYSAITPVKSFDFENDNGLEGLNVASHATALISDETIDGKSVEFNFTSTASDQVNFASFNATLEPETYYQVSFLLRDFGGSDRWFHVVPVDSEGRKLADAYFNLLTGVVDGFGFDRISDSYNDMLQAKVVTFGFYTNKCTDYTIGLNLGINDTNVETRVFLDNISLVKGATYYGVNYGENTEATSDKSCYKIGDIATVTFNNLEEKYEYVATLDGKVAQLSSDNDISFVVTKEHTVELLSTVKEYTVTCPTLENAQLKIADDYSTTVEHGKDFKFSVELDEDYSESNIIVKANDTVLTAVDGVYTIENITANVSITVEGIVSNTPIENSSTPSEEPSDTNEPTPSKGCNGSVAGSSLAILSLAALAMVLKKKRVK